MTFGLIGVVVSLILLIVLAYRGVSVIVAAPLCAVVAMLFSGAPLLAGYTQIFMPALANFVLNYFPIFVTGAIFGRLMSVTGYAEAIARTITRWLGPSQAILATILTAAVLTYGGISTFVAVFVMFPLAKELFRQADIPRRLIPASIAVGTLTFTMTAIPGSPQIQNIIPGQFFGTSTFAAPVIGTIGGVMMFTLGLVWVNFRARRLAAAGESFVDASILEQREAGETRPTVGAASVPQGREGGSGLDGHGRAPVMTREADANAGVQMLKRDSEASEAIIPLPKLSVLAFLPVIAVFAVNFLATTVILPAMNWDYLSEERYGGISLSDRVSLWAVLCALLVAIAMLLLMNARHFRALVENLASGAKNSLLPIFSTASEVGYGAVVASLAAFAIIRDGILTEGANALVASAVSTSVIAGITGSASGGMTIALNALGADLESMAQAQGITMEAMHRVTAMASGGLDSMPHNGAVITLLMVCGMTHRESYKDVGVVTLVIPVLVTAVVIGGLVAMG